MIGVSLTLVLYSPAPLAGIPFPITKLYIMADADNDRPSSVVPLADV